MNKYELSASLICCDPLNLESELHEIEKANFQSIHFDVMDGLFVPRYGLYPEILENLNKITKLPVDIHLMIANPDKYIKLFNKKGVRSIYIHAEGNDNLHKSIKLIKQTDVNAGVVLNMETSLSVLDLILSDIDHVMLMAIRPGILGQNSNPKIYEKIAQLKKRLKGYPITIMIDGGVNNESSAKMIKCGANILVCGTSSIFRSKERTVAENTDVLRNAIEKGKIK